MGQSYKHFAFISYNTKDAKWARKIQRKLEHYRMPTTLCNQKGWAKNPPIQPVFFAETDIQLSNDEAQNMAGALNLQKDKRLRSMVDNKPIIYVHARRDANNEVFDHYSQYDEDSQRMEIKIVDSAYLSIVTLKQDEAALPVNCVKIDKATGLVNSPFTSLIVGFGSTGKEAFKFLYEYSAFVGPDLKKSPFKCYAIDEKMNKIAGLIRKKMPAIGEDELTLVQATVDSEEFWENIETLISGLNYVVIALNNDSMGLSLAVNLFKYALKYRPSSSPMLKIMVRFMITAMKSEWKRW